jgi:hypothetical protein
MRALKISAALVLCAFIIVWLFTNTLVSGRSVSIPTNADLPPSRYRLDASQSDFKVKATSALHGMIRVRDKLKFTFDIVGHK